MGPPPMDQSWPIGWGNMAPPMRPPHPKPRHHGDDVMEIDEVYQPPRAPSQTSRDINQGERGLPEHPHQPGHPGNQHVTLATGAPNCRGEKGRQKHL
jgi:hypothetical protein